MKTLSLWLGISLCQDPRPYLWMPDFGFLPPLAAHSPLAQVHPTPVTSLGSISFSLVPWHLALILSNHICSLPLPHPIPQALAH